MTPNNSEGPKSRTEIRAAYQYLDPLCLCVCSLNLLVVSGTLKNSFLCGICTCL